MPRDMDLMRQILIELDSVPYSEEWKTITVPGHSPDEINHHALLLHDAGLVDAYIINLGLMKEVKLKRLTNKGHEFLEHAKSSKVWEAAKEWTLKTTGTLTLDGLKLAFPYVLKALMNT